jgi:tRNA-intron endonuclease
MHGEFRDGEVVVGGDARQRFYDASGYGRPLDGNEIALTRVEAAHLLLRGDLDTVDGMDFRAFFADSADRDGFGVRFLVYADLRGRGFYLSPSRASWVPDPREAEDFVVYERGKGPDDGAVAHRVRAVGERTPVQAADLGDCVLAVVDEESEVTYFETDRVSPDGVTDMDLPAGVAGDLLADRVLLWAPPPDLHDRGFYGQPVADRDGVAVDAVQLSLLEAAYLAARGVVDVSEGYDGIVAAGRGAEGDRFDRRLRAYAALRERGVVPKTGFKFGADFRTYAEMESVSDLGHSERLVRVLPAEHTFLPRDLALDVRLAHGVRKEMTFALVPPEGDVEWLAVRRLTP